MSDVIRFFNTHKPKSSPGHLELALDHSAAQPGDVVLDLCCGAGKLAALAAERGWRACGVDISTEYIGTAADKASGAVFVVGDMVRVPFRSGCAQIVYCIDSLQYASDPAQTLAECARLLRPGGLLIFSTENTYNPAGLKKWLVEKLTGRVWSPWLAHPVEQSITAPWLLTALARQGFAVEYVRGRQMLTPWISLLPAALRNWAPWPGKPWRTPQGIAQRARIPARIEESALGRLGMILFVVARKE